MRLASVKIKNFKSLADTGEVELANVNLLVGRNNHGKSAFIRAVHAMQQGAILGPGDVRLGETTAVIRLTLVGTDIDDLRRYYGQQITDAQLSYEIHIGLQQTGSGRPPSYSIGFTTDSRTQLTPGVIASQEPDNFIYTYLSKRKVVAFDREVDRHRTRSVQSNLQYLVSKVARLANPDYVHAAEYTELCMALFGFRISVHAAEDGTGQQAGIPVGSYGYIPIEAMGEGVSSQLGLITDLCMADGNLFLIEEPENDIHPEGLKTLLNVIVEKSKDNQFIISTHSNIVMRYLGAAPSSKILEFESDFIPNHIPTSVIRDVGTAPQARLAVLRRLGYELSDFDLWNGWLILEESSAEIIIKYLIPWFVPKLAQVRTVAAGGTSKVEPTFEDYRRLFLFAHLEPQYRDRAWVIVDGDAAGKKVVAALQDKYNDWPSDHFVTWTEEDFERYYPAQFTPAVDAALAKGGQEKRDAKKQLLDEVKAWANSNSEEAKAAFEQSAAEVIAILRKISEQL